MLPRSRTLFGRTLFTIGLVSAGVLVFMLAVVGWFALRPVGHRTTHDLAGIMTLLAHRWSIAGADERERIAREALARHQIRLRAPVPDLPKASRPLPYFFFLEGSLSDLHGRDIGLTESVEEDGLPWFWAVIPTRDKPVQVGISGDRIAVHLPLALTLLVLVGGSVTVATAVVLVRRTTAPVERLAQAARRIGRGEWPEALAEDGPQELADLARGFNQMVVQVQELLANRTTLLAGISHDLRTPLARMQIAVEMLPEASDPELVAGLRRDLEQMNLLIGQFLEVSRGLSQQQREPLQLDLLIDELVLAARRQGACVLWPGGPRCVRPVQAMALRRTVGNLLENALRYGAGQPVEVQLECGDEARIVVLDRGPGIPVDQLEAVFRPFHRLEGSRSGATGGSGLGLAIARQLASANGWRIALAQRPGGGLAATLTLPPDPGVLLHQ